MRVRFAGATALAIAGFMTLGCSGISSPSKNTLDTFTGTLPLQGGNGHAFSAAKTGEFTVHLTALTPNANALVGLALTQGNNDGTCTTSVLQQNNFVTVNAQALGGQMFAGKYCVLIYDIGTLTVPQTYTFTVSHPPA